VTTPSDLVVMQNTVTKDKTTGIIDTVNDRFRSMLTGGCMYAPRQQIEVTFTVSMMPVVLSLVTVFCITTRSLGVVTAK